MLPAGRGKREQMVIEVVGYFYAAATALNYFAYNFIKIHRTLRMNPVMAAPVADRVWSMEDLVTVRKIYEQPGRKERHDKD